MATSKTLHGDTINIPVTDEVDWGAEVSAYQATFAEDHDAICFQDSDGNVFNRIKWSTVTLADAATLTPATSGIRLEGTTVAITLNGTTAIADGEVDGQVLVIKGTDATKTVTINDGANTDLNGNITLGDGDKIYLLWDSTDSEWGEVSRNN